MDKGEVGRPALGMAPAPGSPSSAPPRHVAAASASHGSRPAATRHSTSQASWLARVEPPPKSVPVAIEHAGRVGQADALAGTRLALGAGPAALGVEEPLDDGRGREAGPRPEDAQRRDEGRAPGRHLGRDVRIELETVLDGVDAGGHRHPRPGKVRRSARSPGRPGHGPPRRPVRTSSTVHGETLGSGPSRYSLTRSAPSSSWPTRPWRAGRPRHPPRPTSSRGSVPVRNTHEPAARTCG